MLAPHFRSVEEAVLTYVRLWEADFSEGQHLASPITPGHQAAGLFALELRWGGFKIRHMANKDVLLDVVEKVVSPKISLTPHDAMDQDGYKLPAISNLGMGYVFEELIRKFNEENNEEAGEHFTPREVIELMPVLVFDPLRTTCRLL